MIEKFEISAKTLIAYELSMIFKLDSKETKSNESLSNNEATFKYLHSNYIE